MHRELVVLSHLRWNWVWQRPQHLISRLSRRVDKTWFVEEPGPAETATPTLAHTDAGEVTRVWLEIPDPGQHVGFEFPYIDAYRRQLPELIGEPSGERIVWLYTPLALEAARALQPSVLVFDVMDDL